MMMEDAGKQISRTGNSENPFGEMTGREKAQIGRQLAISNDNQVFGTFAKSLPVVGPIMEGLDSAGLISFDSPLADAMMGQYGKGTLSSLFGDDPGIDAATQAVYDGRRASLTPGNPEGRGPGVRWYEKGNGLNPSASADAMPPGAEEPAEPTAPAGTGLTYRQWLGLDPVYDVPAPARNGLAARN
jgi:hypothetical protein